MTDREPVSRHGVKTVEAVIDQVIGFWRSAILKAALDLHIADHLAAGNSTAAAVAEAEGSDPRATEVLMNALSGLGFLDKCDGQYRLEPLVVQLLPTMKYLTPFSLDTDALITWNSLTEAVISGRPVGKKPDYWENFARATREMTRMRGALLASAGVGGRDIRRIMDVGCGSGGLGFAWALANPAVTVTGFDRESVLPIAASHAHELGIEDQVRLSAVDVIAADSLGRDEFDLAILSNMLHLFDERSNRALLTKTGAALVEGGRIVIQDIVADEDRRVTAYPLMFAVELLLRTTAGTTYTTREIDSWLAEAGFREIECSAPMAYLTTITATKHTRVAQ